MILESRAIPAGRNFPTWQVGSIDLRVLILDVVQFQLGVAGLVFTIINVRFKANRDAAPAAIVQS